MSYYQQQQQPPDDDGLAYGDDYSQSRASGQPPKDRSSLGDTLKRFKAGYDSFKNPSSPSPPQNYGYGGSASSNQGYYGQQAANTGYPQVGQSAYPGGPPTQPAAQRPDLGTQLLGTLHSTIHNIGTDVAGLFGSSGPPPPNTANKPPGASGYNNPAYSNTTSASSAPPQGRNRFDSFAAERPGNDVKWYVDGCSYFWAVSQALEGAKESIWILDWWLSPELYLRRPPSKNEQWRLDRTLQRAAQRGVKVNIIVYKEVTQALSAYISSPVINHLHSLLPPSTNAMTSFLVALGLRATATSVDYLEKENPLILPPLALSSAHTKHELEKLSPNIAVFRHPDHLPDAQTAHSSLLSSFQGLKLDAAGASKLGSDALKGIYGLSDDVVLYWAHHEKLCLIDGKIAFMGGLDLCFGRWDTNQHAIADAHPNNVNDIVFPGQDFNNARVMDFSDVANPFQNKLDRTKSSRMGWSDIALSLHGTSVQDLRHHFIDRWNFIYDEKYNVRQDVRYSRIADGFTHSASGIAQRPQSQGHLQAPQPGGAFPPPPGSQPYAAPAWQSTSRPHTPNPSDQYQTQQPIIAGQPGGQQGQWQAPTGQYSQGSFPPPPPGSPPHVQPTSATTYPGNIAPPSPQPQYSGGYQQNPSPSPQPYAPNQQPTSPPPQQYGSSPQIASPPPQQYAGIQQSTSPTPQQWVPNQQSPGSQPQYSAYSQGINPTQSPPVQPYQQTAYQSAPGEQTRGFDDNYQGQDGERGFGNERGMRGRFDQYRDEGRRIGQELSSIGNIVSGGVEQKYHQYSNKYFSPTGSYGRIQNQPRGPMTTQILRSCTKWSNGTPLETSIQNAYIEVIKNSQHFVYIENQFFITATGDQQKPVKNLIGQAIVERILRAARNGEKYKIIVVIPAVPAFAGDLRDEASLGTRAIMEFQYFSINRGGHSIMEKIAQAGFNPLDYIRFYNLRSYDRINRNIRVEQQSNVSYEDARKQHDDAVGAGYGQYGEQTGVTNPNQASQYQQYQSVAQNVPGSGRWDSVAECYMLGGPDIRSVPWDGPPEAELNAFVSEELYIHSKTLIADDRIVICGSANLNDRSQLGSHDSEIAILVNDPTPVQSYMYGQPYQVSRFAASLRRQLFRKHLGLIAPQDIQRPDANYEPVGVPNAYDWGTPEDNIVADPLSDALQSLWNTRARTNTEVFRKAFRAVPDDNILGWEEYKEFYEYFFQPVDDNTNTKDKSKLPPRVEYGHVVPGDFPGGVQELKALLSQVKGTLVEMPLCFLQNEDIAKEGLTLNALTEELYT